MAKKTRGRTSALQWVIRILILLIFVIAAVIAVRNVMEGNRNLQEAEQHENELTEQQNGDQTAE